MRKRDFAALGKQLLPDLPGFAVKAPLLLIPPVVPLLRGVFFEDHSHDAKRFYVWMFILPLFVPRDYVSFEFGERIGSYWDADSPDLVGELGRSLRMTALPYLASVGSAGDIPSLVAARQLPLENPQVRQVTAFAFARAGDMDKALGVLNELTSSVDLSVPWKRKIAERADVLKSKIHSGPTEVQRQLQAWEDESVRNLGLEGFR